MTENGYIDVSERGARIAGLRAKRGFTLRELARQLGTSVSTLSRYEAGLVERIPQPTMEKLAILLGTTAGYLQYGGEEGAASASGSDGTLMNSRASDYLHIYRSAELSQLFRAGQLTDREFMLIVDEDTALPPRILPGDQITIAQDRTLRPDAVYLLLRTDGRLCLRDVQAVNAHGIQDAFLLKTREGGEVEVFLPAEGYRTQYLPIGLCVKLEAQKV